MSVPLKLKKLQTSSAMRCCLTGIRILIGWHFLYEGLSKLVSSDWTAAGYLLKSNWLFSGFFHWIAETPSILKFVDMVNIWGITLIGLALFFGIFARAASIAGASLLMLYYIANPPFIGPAATEAHYLIVNNNIIETAMLILIAILPGQMFYGLGNLFAGLIRKRGQSDTEVSTFRRNLLIDAASLPLFGGFIFAFLKKYKWQSFEEKDLAAKLGPDVRTGASRISTNAAALSDLKAKVVAGKLGKLDVSRLICGGNLISGYAHSRDLIYVSKLLKHYFTDEKVIQTFSLCQACGINTAILAVEEEAIRVLNEYRRRGGRMQWIAQARIRLSDPRSQIDLAIDNGADAIFIQGGISDSCVKAKRFDFLNQALEYIRSQGLPAGLAGHDLAVPIECEKAGLNPEFYMKTINSGNYWTAGPRVTKDPDWIPEPLKVIEPEFIGPQHDNMWASSPQHTIEYMKQLKKPWIGYKVLGAGAIRPEEGFRYAFENGTDFICVGMFDYQVVEDANIVTDILSANLNRTRPWMG